MSTYVCEYYWADTLEELKKCKCGCCDKRITKYEATYSGICKNCLNGADEKRCVCYDGEECGRAPYNGVVYPQLSEANELDPLQKVMNDAHEIRRKGEQHTFLVILELLKEASDLREMLQENITASATELSSSSNSS